MTCKASRMFAAGAGLIAAVTLASACSSSGSGGGSGGSGSSSVSIALVAPYSGDTAYEGDYVTQAWQLAFDTKGSAPGGHKISLNKYDDQCTPAKAQSAVRQIVGTSSVIAAEGPICSGALAAVQQRLSGAGLPHIAIGFGNSLTTSGDKTIYRVATPTRAMTDALAKFMTTKGVTKLAIVNDTSGYSVDVADSFKASAKKSNISVAADYTFTGGATDFSGQIARLKSLGVKNVAIGCYQTDCGHFVKQANQLALGATIWGLTTVEAQDFVSAIGSGYQNVVDDGKVYFATDWLATANIPAVQNFVKAYEKKFNSNVPDADSAALYAGDIALMQALSTIKGSVDKQKLVDALAKVKVSGTPMGDVEFDSHGDLKCPPVYIGQWTAGKPQLLQNQSPSCSGLAG